MAIRERLVAGMSRQLGRPAGLFGRIVGRLLNRGNRPVIRKAVEATEVTNGSTVADIGFGGGAGLALLLERVGPTGIVHGIEISQTMLAETRRRYRNEIANHRLELHDATMQSLPLPDGSIDAVVSTNTIYFVEELGPSVSELARVVRPGGRVVLGVGDPAAMAKMPFTKHGFVLRPISEVVESLRLAGLELVEDRRVGEGSEAFHVLVTERV